jgi:hypothetical protein
MTSTKGSSHSTVATGKLGVTAVNEISGDIQRASSKFVLPPSNTTTFPGWISPAALCPNSRLTGDVLADLSATGRGN